MRALGLDPLVVACRLSASFISGGRSVAGLCKNFVSVSSYLATCFQLLAHSLHPPDPSGGIIISAAAAYFNSALLSCCLVFIICMYDIVKMHFHLDPG